MAQVNTTFSDCGDAYTFTEYWAVKGVNDFLATLPKSVEVSSVVLHRTKVPRTVRIEFWKDPRRKAVVEVQAAFSTVYSAVEIDGEILERIGETVRRRTPDRFNLIQRLAKLAAKKSWDLANLEWGDRDLYPETQLHSVQGLLPGPALLAITPW